MRLESGITSQLTPTEGRGIHKDLETKKRPFLNDWPSVAAEREMWKSERKSFTHQWDTIVG